MVASFILKVYNFSYWVRRMMFKGPTKVQTRSDCLKKSFGKGYYFGTDNIFIQRWIGYIFENLS